MKRLLPLFLVAGCAGDVTPTNIQDAGNVSDMTATTAASDLPAPADSSTAGAPDLAMPVTPVDLAAAAPPDLASSSTALPPDTAGARADAVLQALLRDEWSGADGYLVSAPGSTTTIGYWIFAEALDAILDGVQRTHGAHYAGLVETWYLAQVARGWSSGFYDDENWMAMSLLRAYDLTGESKYLAEADALFVDIMGAWDTSCCGATKGGVWWDKKHTQKATASNAGPVVTAVRLAARENKPGYLAWAQQVYGFWSANMVNPTTHQVADHIVPDGTVTWWRFTYNEGLFIAASLALHDATGDATYLTNAQVTASFMRQHETKGGVLFDGSDASCTGDCAEFKGIGFRHLIDTTTVADPFLSDNVDAIWNVARDGANHVAADWTAPPGNFPVEAQVSAALALGSYAIADGAPAPASDPAHVEAEDAVLHHVGLEGSHQGFSGWGYVAGWKGDGQWVDFHVVAPAGGTKTITLRYAAGAGDATRYVFVDGAGVVANQKLASTGSWDAWATVTINHGLGAGAHTVSVIYDSSKGSTNYVNLDYVAVN